ncbi:MULTISPECIES: polysaccharide pyruvyl transferase family protein [unclassified Sphingobium]|uniref:polysaccharide pyruvyl transferase family protein n=1 Tax=unclassified Sphingobium TaxID=2611147 RepID=UPI0035A5E8F1
MEPTEKTISNKLMALWKQRDFEVAQAYAEELRGEGGQWEDVLRSFNALWELEHLAAANDVPDRFRPRIWWMRGPYPGNFGDILTPYVLWNAFRVIPRWTPYNQAQGLCIGSIAKFSRPGSKMWGTGMPRATDPLAADAVWAAVRGPLSRDAVLAAGGDVPEIYGDGAVLLPEIYAPEVEKIYRVGIIPHVLQEQQLREALERSGKADGVKIISLLAASFDDIERVIRDILSCSEIVSTSLHGVIVSHAYGVPCQSARVVKPGEDAEDSFKMRDYKMSVGLDDNPIGIPEQFDSVEWLDDRQCVLPPGRIDTKALRAAFPFVTPAKERSGRAGEIRDN